MLNSIRWSLQLWHAGLLAVVLTGFGSASYYAISRAHYQEVDSQLERSVLLLANELRYPPRPPGIGRGGGGRGGRGGGRGGGPDRPPDRNPGGPGGFGPGGEGPGGPGGGAGFGPGRFGPGGPPGGGPGGGPGGPRVDPNLTEIEVPPNIAQRFGDGESDTFYYVLWDFDREMTKTSRTTADIPEPPPRSQDSFGPPPPPNAEPPTLRERGNFREYYVYGPAGPILVGKSTLPDRAQLHQSALLLAAAGAAVLVIGLVGGWLLSFRAVRPIRTITKAAQEISATNLSRRINVAETQNELGTLASVLNDAFARLDAAFQQQVRFTADASHELRTPLAVIHTNTQLALSRERSAEEYRKTIETCQRASSRMKGLVDSLLVLAKADAGRLSLEPSRFDLSSVVQDCMAMVTPLAQEKHVSLESDLRAVELTADLSRVGQVVTNLLSNAIRYNREGGSVRAKVESVGKDAVLTITDTGVGIPAENQPHLFERFYRVDAARSRELGGSGLGLAICKSIVEAHGGTIFFQSEFGKGSTFTIRLPLGPVAAPPN